MKQIPVTDLRPGMVTAEDILTYDLKMIVPKGVVLTENIISRLESYSGYYVHIDWFAWWKTDRKIYRRFLSHYGHCDCDCCYM